VNCKCGIHIPSNCLSVICFQNENIINCILQVAHKTNELVPIIFIWFLTSCTQKCYCRLDIKSSSFTQKHTFITNVWKVSFLSFPNRFALLSTLNRFSVQGVEFLPCTSCGNSSTIDLTHSVFRTPGAV